MARKVLFVLTLLLLATVIPSFAQNDAMSASHESLVGRYQFVKGEVSADDQAITLPLYQGRLTDGTPLWYILTDASDPAEAAQWGINYSPALAGAAGLTRTATDDHGTWVFDKGRVDFSPEHKVVPGAAPNPFPPAQVQPGSVGDADYTPLVTVNNVVFNAPILAFGVSADAINFCDGSNVDYSKVHDKVLKICPSHKTVTVALSNGFGFGRVIVYLSTDGNVDVAAALEASTLAPRLNDLANKADSPLFLAVNGPEGKDNPVRQGVDSALSGEGGPRNLLGQIPGLSDNYSPIWNVSLYVWTDAAIKAGYRTQLIDSAYQLPNFIKGGWITAPDGGAIKSSGPLVNCPVILREQ